MLSLGWLWDSHGQSQDDFCTGAQKSSLARGVCLWVICTELAVNGQWWDGQDCVVELNYGRNSLEPRENSRRKRAQNKGPQKMREQFESLGMPWASEHKYMHSWVLSLTFSQFTILLTTFPSKLKPPQTPLKTNMRQCRWVKQCLCVWNQRKAGETKFLIYLVKH